MSPYFHISIRLRINVEGGRMGILFTVDTNANCYTWGSVRGGKSPILKIFQ